MKFTLRHIANRHYAFFDPSDPWTRDHYHKLTLDKFTFEELGCPEFIDITIERRDDAPTQEEENDILGASA